jgi:hypothetical protein
MPRATSPAQKLPPSFVDELPLRPASVPGSAMRRLSDAITGAGHACWMDLEGIVSKRLGSPYVSGRTRAWLKTKNPDFERR